MVNSSNFIVLFDGDCNLCNSSVNFIIKHDTEELFYFASLQSDVSKQILLQFSVKKTDFNTVVLIENNNMHIKSTAILKILRHLKHYRFLYFLIYIPVKIRDFIYNIIANNRYKWFGKKKQCAIYTDKIKKRFL